MTFATDMLTMSDELITELGNTATFKDVTSETPDPTTGSVSKVTADKTVKVGGPFGVDPRLVEGHMYQDGDAMIILSAKGITTWAPNVDERVVIDSKTWVIVSITEHRAQDTLIAWEMHIRR